MVTSPVVEGTARDPVWASRNAPVQTDMTTSLRDDCSRIQSSILGDLPRCAPITTIFGGGALSKVYVGISSMPPVIRTGDRVSETVYSRNGIWSSVPDPRPSTMTSWNTSQAPAMSITFAPSVTTNATAIGPFAGATGFQSCACVAAFADTRRSS